MSVAPVRGWFRPRSTPVVALVCLALGVWQLERWQWKRNLIAERQAAIHAAPVPVPGTLEEARHLEFHPVIAEGVFLNDKEILSRRRRSGRRYSGLQVLTPLRLKATAASSSSIAASSLRSERP